VLPVDSILLHFDQQPRERFNDAQQASPLIHEETVQADESPLIEHHIGSCLGWRATHYSLNLCFNRAQPLTAVAAIAPTSNLAPTNPLYRGLD
jgi:hypothetical protein